QRPDIGLDDRRPDALRIDVGLRRAPPVRRWKIERRGLAGRQVVDGERGAAARRASGRRVAGAPGGRHDDLVRDGIETGPTLQLDVPSGGVASGGAVVLQKELTDRDRSDRGLLGRGDGADRDREYQRGSQPRAHGGRIRRPTRGWREKTGGTQSV